MKNLFIALIAIATLSACSMSGEIVSLDEQQKTQLAKLKGAEFVSAGNPKATTSQGYTVSTALGSLQGQLTAKTSAGYKVYTSVQGQVISDDSN